MFVLQVYLAEITNPISLVFKEKEAAEKVQGAIHNIMDASVFKDNFGGELMIDVRPRATLIIDQEKFYLQQSDMDLANKKAMHKHAQRLQADPTLRFLQGQQGFKSPLMT